MRIRLKLWFIFLLIFSIASFAGGTFLFAATNRASFTTEFLLVGSIVAFWSILFSLVVEGTVGIPLRDFQKRLLSTRERGQQIFSIPAEPSELAELRKSFSGILQELELKTKALQKKRELDAMKYQFISTISHQLRTPLTGLRWSLTMLSEGKEEVSEKEKGELLRGSRDATERIATIISRMLQTVEISAGDTPRGKQEIDVVTLIEAIVAENVLLARSREVTVEVQRDGERIPTISGDSFQLSTVFHSLLSNAIYYSNRGGVVTVSLSQEGKSIVISIVDHGIGIDEENKGRIFEKFYRGKRAIEMHTDGMGLGLYFSKNIVEDHGGTISFQSVRDKGTTFRVHLPVSPAGELETFIRS